MHIATMKCKIYGYSQINLLTFNYTNKSIHTGATALVTQIPIMLYVRVNFFLPLLSSLPCLLPSFTLNSAMKIW